MAERSSYRNRDSFERLERNLSVFAVTVLPIRSFVRQSRLSVQETLMQTTFVTFWTTH